MILILNLIINLSLISDLVIADASPVNQTVWIGKKTSIFMKRNSVHFFCRQNSPFPSKKKKNRKNRKGSNGDKKWTELRSY